MVNSLAGSSVAAAMQTQKVFFRKTRRGKILKVVREHYLRRVRI